MKILVDQNMPVSVAEELRAAGYDCIHNSEIGLSEEIDSELLEFSRSESRLIITKDKGDFTFILAKTGASAPSLILIRSPLADEATSVQVKVILSILQENEQALNAGAIISLSSKEKSRIRLLPIEGFSA